jgi:hypothetical protein
MSDIRVIFEGNDGSGSVAITERQRDQLLIVCAEMGGDNAGCEMDRDGIRGLRDALTEWLDTQGIGYFVASEEIRAGDPVAIVENRARRSRGTEQPLIIAERDYEPGEKIKWSLT